jgi:cellulose synthase operon protein YhjQ
VRPEPPEDVANLCDVAELDTNYYKVFTRQRTPVPAEVAAEPVTPERGSAKLIVEPEAEQAVTPMHSPPEMPSHRWTMLRAVTDAIPGADSDDYRVVSEEIHVPTIAVFSMAGGVGKTTILAALARALSRTGQRVLVVHGVEQNTLTLHFGGQSVRPGRLHTFLPPTRKEGQINVLAHEFDEAPRGVEIDGWLQREVAAVENEVDRVLVEVSRLNSEDQHFLGLAHTTLAVLVPDIGSLLSVAKLKNWLEQQNRAGFRKVDPYFLLNKFDANSAFHNEVRDRLHQQLGSRLLPFTIRRSDLAAEALASGMTILDYAPKASVADDFLRLAAWAGKLGNVREMPASKSKSNAVSAL